MFLFYNGNSAMAQAQLNDWSEVTSGQGKQIDASEPSNFSSAVGTTDKDNANIPLREAFQAALARTSDQTPRAIILSANSYFTMRRGRIIRIIKHLTTKKQNPVKNLVMCYPLDEYDQDAKEAGFDPEKDFAIVGPSLADVYFTLGKRAAQILGSKGIVPDSEGATIIKKPT